MNNVVPFPGKQATPAPAAPAAPSLPPGARRYPLDVEQVPLLPPNFQVQLPIHETAAMQVVAALAFYANQGHDGGKKARLALRGMNTVFQSQH